MSTPAIVISSDDEVKQVDSTTTTTNAAVARKPRSKPNKPKLYPAAVTELTTNIVRIVHKRSAEMDIEKLLVDGCVAEISKEIGAFNAKSNEEESSRNKNKKQKRIKPDGKPSQPTNGCFRFLHDEKVKAKVMAEHSELASHKEYTRKASAIWKEMSEAERAPWQGPYLDAKAVYDKLLQEWNAQNGKNKEKPVAVDAPISVVVDDVTTTATPEKQEEKVAVAEPVIQADQLAAIVDAVSEPESKPKGKGKKAPSETTTKVTTTGKKTAGKKASSKKTTDNAAA